MAIRIIGNISDEDMKLARTNKVFEMYEVKSKNAPQENETIAYRNGNTTIVCSVEVITEYDTLDDAMYDNAIDGVWSNETTITKKAFTHALHTYNNFRSKVSEHLEKCRKGVLHLTLAYIGELKDANK